VLVVAHNTLLRLGLCVLLGLPVARYRQVFPRLDNVAVTEIALPDGGTGPVALLSLNVPVGNGVAPAPPHGPDVPTQPITKNFP
jgi:probable phosphoglycerate mutase